MAQMRIFVSHSSQDNGFCTPLVEGLQQSGADIWYDNNSMGAGSLLKVINHELATRSVFIVALSKPAFSSDWVTRECEWAYNLYTREPERVILPVTAQQISKSDFNAWLFMESFKRIEGPGGSPLPVGEAITQTLDLLFPSKLSNAGPEINRSVLWVDDIPSNNFRERRILEGMGISITISTATDDALGKLVRNHYAAIISDMSRPDDMLAGYTLLEYAHKIGVKTPFILYTGSARPEHVAEAQKRGALGQTSSPHGVIELVRQALGINQVG